ncbi:MAG: polyphosphate kinase 1 [Verrucomicrobiales bacterium]|nr:polyphosphate kinase 1 [Verrucomicrobiales bacterium]
MAATVQDRYFNRELSWLEFNQRVLDEALDAGNPLLERLKFFCIVSSNLDEFFEVRVAGIKQQIESEAVERSPDGRTATETFLDIAARSRRLVADQYRCWRKELLPALAARGFQMLRIEELGAADHQRLDQFIDAEVRPVTTPIAIDPAHPFPLIHNKALNLIALSEVEDGEKLRRRIVVLQVPRVLPRLVELAPEGRTRRFVFLGQVIGSRLERLLPGSRFLGAWNFRVTRNSELYIDEADTGNLLKAVEREVHNRRKGAAVRIEVNKGCPAELTERLLQVHGLSRDDLHVIDGPLSPGGLMAVYAGDHSPELRDRPYLPPLSPKLPEGTNLFEAMRRHDILLHHPYESFETVVTFLQQAAEDPEVLAIKQTLYRTGGDPRITGALMEAVRNGKQVTAVVELKARFDEVNNIKWARELEEAGVQVVYGVVGYKIHCKVTLVVRRDPDGIRRYLHLSTGNYNPTTARIYTDIGLLTCRPDYGEDATEVFNVITGLCRHRPGRRLLVAPFNLHRRMVELVRRETANARRGLPARIIAKMNSLVETEIIDALYEASGAGVEIDLIVRGICCLRPGVPGLSENIRVRSIVGRYLEHSRVFHFENACQPELYLGSADWMPRNFFKRIEVVFPLEDGNLRDRVVSEILTLQLADTVKARMLRRDGRYERVKAPAPQNTVDSQAAFMERALEAQQNAAGPARSALVEGRLKPVRQPGKPPNRQL